MFKFKKERLLVDKMIDIIERQIWDDLKNNVMDLCYDKHHDIEIITYESKSMNIFISLIQYKGSCTLCEFKYGENQIKHIDQKAIDRIAKVFSKVQNYIKQKELLKSEKAIRDFILYNSD